MSLGQILDRVYRLVRANLRPFLGIAAVPSGAVIVASGLLVAALFFFVNPTNPRNPAEFTSKLPYIFAAEIVSLLPFILIYALYEPAAVYAALRADTGIKVSIGEAWSVSWRNAGRYIWLMVLRTLIAAVIFGTFVAIAGRLSVAIFPFKSGTPPRAIFLILPLDILLYVGCIVCTVLISLRLALATPACVIEGLTATAAIRRSGRLTQGAMGRIFLVVLVICAVGYAFYFGLCLVVMILWVIGTLPMVLFHASAIWGFIWWGLMGVILLCGFSLFIAGVSTSYATAFAVLYHDQLRRKDGLLPPPMQAGESV
jgi:hypothetical protein